MDDKEKTRQSYAQAMSDWAAARDAQRTLLSRSRNTLLQPDPLASLPARLLGYVWRFGLVILVGIGGYFLLLMWHFRSEEFSRLVARGAALQLKAEKVEISPFRWRKNVASARSFSAQGGSQSFFKTIEAESVDFRLPLRMSLQKNWQLKHVGVDFLRAELRSGGLGSGNTVSLTPAEKDSVPEGLDGPTSKIAAPIKLTDDPSTKPQESGKGRKVLDLRLHKDGFGVNPNFESLTVAEIGVARGNFTWGVTPFTRGSLQQAALLATPTGQGRWHIALSAGQLQQNWLRDLSIQKLNIDYTGETLQLDSGVFRVGESTNVLSGTITVSEHPRLNLRIDASSLPLEHFLNEPVTSWLRLAASGPIIIEGSLNLASGVTTSADLKIDGGALRQIPLLNTLAVLTGRGRFRDLEITGGFIKFNTAQGKLEVPAFELQAKSDVLIRGSGSWQQGSFRGNAQLGMSQAYAQRLPAQLQQAFLRQDDAGWLWLEIPLDGPPETLTKQLSNKLAAAFQEASRK
ncbi:MAG: hypothetical protein ACR2OZ_16735 [Verrucomicrobiales bacterium]